MTEQTPPKQRQINAVPSLAAYGPDSEPLLRILESIPEWKRLSLETQHWVLAILLSRPVAGSGVHKWLFRAAKTLCTFMSKQEAMVQILEFACSGCERVVPIREIQQAVMNALDDERQQSYGLIPPWPEADQERIQELVRINPGLGALREASPVQLDDSPHAEEIIDLFFPGNPLLCVGATSYSFDTRPRENWRGFLHKQQLVVPSAMSAQYGTTQDGRRSKHTLSNTGPRQYLVTEFDAAV